MTMRTPLLYAGMLAARELTNVLQGNRLGATLCELHDEKPEFICSASPSMLVKLFEANTNRAEHASLVHHGTVMFTDGRKYAAIMMRAATVKPKWTPFVVGLPYRVPNHADGFAIYEPVVLSDAPPEADDWLEFLFEGFETENPDLWSKYGEELED